MLTVNGGGATKKYIIETTGRDVAVIDYDNDRWLDIFVINGTTLDTHHLYHNNRDGTFRESATRVEIHHASMPTAA